MSSAKPKSLKEKFHDALDDLLDRPIAFNPAFLRMISDWVSGKARAAGRKYGNAGAPAAAIFLSQAWYWSKRTSNPDGWFYKSILEWEEETGLSENTQYTCRRLLGDQNMGVIEEVLKGVPATVHYRVLRARVYELLGFQFPVGQETEQPDPQETEQPDPQETGSPSPTEQVPDGTGNFNKESENTTVISPETTNQELDFQNSWQRVLDEVQRDTLRASFDAHIRDTQAVRFDGNVLEIAAANEESRAWLESRLTRSAENLLIGILNAEVSVVFVVGELEA